MKLKEKTILFVLFSIIFSFISCATTYTKVELQSYNMKEFIDKNVNDDDVKVKRSFLNKIKNLFKKDDRMLIEALQYYVSDMVVYSWLEDETAKKSNYIITQDGKLILAEAEKDRMFIIYEDTLGVLYKDPEIRDGKIVLTIDFNNIIVEFTENDDGLFYLTTSEIEYKGYSYVTDDSCKLMLEVAVEKESEVTESNARGKKISN